MNTSDLLRNELQKWRIDRNIDGKFLDYETMKTAVGKFVFTIPTYVGSGVARFGISTAEKHDPCIPLDHLIQIAYFCSAKCNKIVGGMPRIFQVDHLSAGKPGLEYYCTHCKCLLNEPVQL